MLNTTVGEMASETMSVASTMYNNFSTPVNYILAILGVGVMITLLIKAFTK